MELGLDEPRIPVFFDNLILIKFHMYWHYMHILFNCFPLHNLLQEPRIPIFHSLVQIIKT
jgi:hypothetical protein